MQDQDLASARPSPFRNGEGTRHDRGDELSLIGLANFVLRNRWLFFGLPIGAFCIAVGLNLLLKERTYTASTSFVPQSSQARRGDLSGLAAQFGLSLGGSESGRSPAFYAELVRSRAILEEIVETEFQIVDGGTVRRGTLVELYEVKGANEQERKEHAIRTLHRDIVPSTSRETGIIAISVRARSPELATQVADRLVELVNRFNVETRQSQAGAERAFVEQRLQEEREQLLQAENLLQAFLQGNREFDRSPQLRFQYDRLQREVGSLQQLVNALQQNFEQARIDEVRDLPVITLIERAAEPTRPDGRNSLGIGILALVIGSILAFILAFLREAARRGEREAKDDYAQFVQLKQQTLAELRPWRRKEPAA